jgi:hypothetical protein
VDIENVKYMLVSRHQNASQNRDIKIASRSFGNVSDKLRGFLICQRIILTERPSLVSEF